MNTQLKTMKIISGVSMILLLLVAIFGYNEYNEYKELQQSAMKFEQSTKEEIERFIYSILIENKSKQTELLSIYAKNIQNDILDEYSNNKEFQNDVENPKDDSKLSHILYNNLGKVFANEDSNLNKPFVASVSNIIWNSTYLYEIKDSTKTNWKDIIKNSYNTKLAEQAIDCIISIDNRKDNLIFWQTNDTNDNSENNIVNMTMEDLADFYYNNGLNSMKNYELLVPVYITDTGDVFGTADYNNLGEPNTNCKIIIIQRVNIYDILKAHKTGLLYYQEKQSNIEQQIESNCRKHLFLLAESVIIAVFIVCGNAYMQHKIITHHEVEKDEQIKIK